MLRKRYRRILFFFARVLVSVAIWDLILPRIGFAKWSNSTRSERYRKIAKRYRSLAIQMGGVLIKVGQFLSARVDVLPVAITDELAGLQDEVPAEKFDDMRRVAEAEFGMPLLDKYSEFDSTPLAAASLGQAHLAKVHLAKSQAIELGIIDPDYMGKDGIDYGVVVKIQRPNIENIIQTDLAAIRTAVNWIKNYPPIRKRVNIPGLLSEFSRTLYEEIDYLAEGRNAETFALNFIDHPGVLVPKVVWTHTTKRVLTLQDVRGIKITDYDAITAAGIDKTEVASRLCDTYLKQIFEDGFFHADPHPGNLFIKPLYSLGITSQTNQDWILTFIDFGMVGRMRPEIRTGLRELLIGISLQDAARVIKAYQTLGILLPGADTQLLERAESEMFKRFWGKGMDELNQISMDDIHDFAYEFRDILYNLPFQLPQDLIFLGRAIGILSGMCTGLDPRLNVFEHIGPFSQKIIAEETTHDLNFWLKEAGNIAKKMVTLPIKADELINRIERGEINVRTPHLSEDIRRLERMISKVIGAIIFAVFVLLALQFSSSGQAAFSWIFGIAASCGGSPGVRGRRSSPLCCPAWSVHWM
jgi:predicted unusual protein kinase regulating ubiquinone biosynthesis (AarF/ABC1/UbiB family)